jgi:hypothetical protein
MLVERKVVKGERKGHRQAGSKWDSIPMSIPTSLTMGGSASGFKAIKRIRRQYCSRENTYRLSVTAVLFFASGRRVQLSAVDESKQGSPVSWRCLGSLTRTSKLMFGSRQKPKSAVTKGHRRVISKSRNSACTTVVCGGPGWRSSRQMRSFFTRFTRRMPNLRQTSHVVAICSLFPAPGQANGCKSVPKR